MTYACYGEGHTFFFRRFIGRYFYSIISSICIAKVMANIVRWAKIAVQENNENVRLYDGYH